MNGWKTGAGSQETERPEEIHAYGHVNIESSASNEELKTQNWKLKIWKSIITQA